MNSRKLFCENINIWWSFIFFSKTIGIHIRTTVSAPFKVHGIFNNSLIYYWLMKIDYIWFFFFFFLYTFFSFFFFFFLFIYLFFFFSFLIHSVELFIFVLYKKPEVWNQKRKTRIHMPLSHYSTKCVSHQSAIFMIYNAMTQNNCFVKGPHKCYVY